MSNKQEELRDSSINKTIKIGTIVKFERPKCEAGYFCYDRGITGKVVSIDNNMAEVNVGLYYNIFSVLKDLAIVAKPEDALLPED